MTKHNMFFFFVLAGFLLQGCYTLFKHPGIQTNQGEVEVWITDNCTDCHSVKEFSPEIYRAMAMKDSIAVAHKISSMNLKRFQFEHYPWWFKYYQNDALNQVLNRPSADADPVGPHRGMVEDESGFTPASAPPSVIYTPPVTPVRQSGQTTQPPATPLTKDNTDQKNDKKSKSSSKRPIKKR